MKVIEILKLGQNFIETLQKACVKLDDVRFIELYDEYSSMISEGNKKSYAVMALSEKYGISERQVYYILKRFDTDCRICAAG